VAILHAENEAVLSFKAHVELGDERMTIAFLQDCPFALNDVFLFVLNDKVFIDDFHSHEHAEAPDEVHSGKSTGS
jgi:hypothetical protein